MFSCFDTMPSCHRQTDAVRQHTPRYAGETEY